MGTCLILSLKTQNEFEAIPQLIQVGFKYTSEFCSAETAQYANTKLQWEIIYLYTHYTDCPDSQTFENINNVITQKNNKKNKQRMYIFFCYLQTLGFCSFMVHLDDLRRTHSCSQPLFAFGCIVTTPLWQVLVFLFFFFNPNTRADEPAP